MPASVCVHEKGCGCGRERDHRREGESKQVCPSLKACLVQRGAAGWSHGAKKAFKLSAQEEEDWQVRELEGGRVPPQGSVRQRGQCLGDCVWVRAREYMSMRL